MSGGVVVHRADYLVGKLTGVRRIALPGSETPELRHSLLGPGPVLENPPYCSVERPRIPYATQLSEDGPAGTFFAYQPIESRLVSQRLPQFAILEQAEPVHGPQRIQPVLHLAATLRARRCNATRYHPGRSREFLIVEHPGRSEEHTSELQSRQYLVCRLLLEKKSPLKKTNTSQTD